MRYFFSSHLLQAEFIAPWLPFPLALILHTCVGEVQTIIVLFLLESPPKCLHVQQYLLLHDIELIKSLLHLLYKYSNNWGVRIMEQ